MDDSTVLIKKYCYYDISRYSESSCSSDLDSISDASLSDHSDIFSEHSDTSSSGRELQLKEVSISSKFNEDFNNDNNNDNYDDKEFDVDDYNDNDSNDGDHSSPEDCDHIDQNSDKSSFKACTFVCTVKGCSKKYAIKSNLNHHIQDHHTTNDLFVCFEPQCHRMNFSTNDLLEKHRRKVHENPIFYICKEKRCYKSYGTMKHLEIHQRARGHEGVIQSMNKYTRENRSPKQSISLNRVRRRTYKCSKPGCNSSFDELTGYVNHLRVHPDGETQKVHRCSKLGCNRFFTNLFDLWNHTRYGHATERTHLCEESGCYRSFDTAYGLWVHKRSHIRENPELQEDLKDNEIKIYSRMYPCKVPGCDRVFDNKSAVATHKRYHRNERDVPERDKESESSFESRFTHLENNGKADELDELKCSKTSLNLQGLNDQQQKHKNDKLDQNEVYCDVQGCVFKTDKFEILKKHLYSDHNMKNYHVCDKEGCGFCCANSSNFQKHQHIHVDVAVVHTKKKLFKCESPGCDKVYRRMCFLSSHLRYHKNRMNQTPTMLTDKQQNRSGAVEEKKVEPECKKVYNNIENTKLLLPYVYIENVNLNFDRIKQKNTLCCDHSGCLYATGQLGNLMRHKMIHTGEKPFSCDTAGCNYKCIQKVQLDKHKISCLRKKVPEQPKDDHPKDEQPEDEKKKRKYFCDQARCGKRFYMLISLERHKRDDHGGKGNKICASETIPKGSYDLRKRDKINYKKIKVVGKKKIIKKRPRLNNHNNVGFYPKYACNHQGCSAKFITLKELKKHEARDHITNMNKTPILMSQHNFHNERQIKNVQILITPTDNFVSKKRSNDNSEGTTSSYRLRKRPRTNKIDAFNDDNDCLCKFTGCRKIFDSIRSLKVHQRKFHMITKTYSCDRPGCNFRTKFSEKLEKHQLNHRTLC